MAATTCVIVCVSEDIFILLVDTRHLVDCLCLREGLFLYPAGCLGLRLSTGYLLGIVC